MQASRSLLSAGYLLEESKGRLHSGELVQSIGIASKALRCQGDNWRVSAHTFLKRWHRPVTGVEWGGGTTTLGRDIRHY